MLYERELEMCIDTMKKMHRRGIRICIGGDYGFAWTPQGTNAKDIQTFVEMLGFTPMEAIQAATKYGGEIMGMGNELGMIKEGYLADLLLVDGDPIADVRILQDKSRILAIMKDGKFHKAPKAESAAPANERMSLVWTTGARTDPAAGLDPGLGSWPPRWWLGCSLRVWPAWLDAHAHFQEGFHQFHLQRRDARGTLFPRGQRVHAGVRADA